MPKKTVKKSSNRSQLRPVGARALKSALDTLRPFLAGVKVLDLYAGQGRFAYGALLEGAQHAVLVEHNAVTARELRSLRSKKIPSDRISQILCQDVWSFLEQPSGDLYDVIFVDPPFEEFTSELATRLFLALKDFAHPGTILLVKTPSQMLLSTGDSEFKLWKITQFGEAQLAYFTYGQK